jgi:hypothetical protein
MTQRYLVCDVTLGYRALPAKEESQWKGLATGMGHRAEALPMPMDDGLRLHYDERLLPHRPDSAEALSLLQIWSVRHHLTLQGRSISLT